MPVIDYGARQGWTNPGRQVTQATTFCTVVPQCGPKILRLFLDSWKSNAQLVSGPCRVGEMREIFMKTCGILCNYVFAQATTCLVFIFRRDP
jgi:hypothetical protein